MALSTFTAALREGSLEVVKRCRLLPTSYWEELFIKHLLKLDRSWLEEIIPYPKSQDILYCPELIFVTSVR